MNSIFNKILQNSQSFQFHSPLSAIHRFKCFSWKVSPSNYTITANFCTYNDYKHKYNLDLLGTWDNRIDRPILLKTSIKYGKPIPKISLGNCGSFSVIGRRDYNEDKICIKELAEDLLYFSIFDGHGGSGCSEFCSRRLDHHIKNQLERGETSLESVVKKAFQDVNDSFRRKVEAEPGDTSGTTCTVCILRNSVELVVAHVGDSRAILCRNGKTISLTEDHVPDSKKEQLRIEAHGGYVHRDDSGRCLVNDRLAMSRSLGDLELKSYGVIATPEVMSLEVKHGVDNFLALTTDGVSFVMTDKEVCEHISRCSDSHEAAHLICDLSLQYASQDNSSVIIVPFGAWGKNKSTAIAIDGIGRYMSQSSRYS
ncbi:Protein phosphatase 1K, mitochondrial [Nymphon striatum]|nr:Protein phosphatase 1K, mitochondrial [Nymphon striatum]